MARDGSRSVLDEQSTLLPKKGPAVTPLPRMQIIILLVMRVTEPVSYTLIFPFVNKMMEEIAGIPPSQVGYYAGVVEGCFAFVQFCTVYFWGMVSDRIGRKTVVLTGLTGVMISVTSFGLARSFTSMVLARCIAGAMNGNVAVIKSMLAEITDDTNQARAFAFLPATWAIGATVGPLIGGYFSHPAERFPAIFGFEFLKNYPYFLPCIVGSTFNLLAIVIGFLYLPETLPTHSHKTATTEEADSIASNADTMVGQLADVNDDSEAQPVKPKRPSFLSLIRNPQIAQVLLSWFFLGLLNSCYQAIIPLFCYSTYEHGGIGFSPRQIGLLLSINGMAALFSQTIVFPPVERHLGPVKTYRMAMLFLPLSFMLLPMAHVVYPFGTAVIWAAIGGMIISKTISNMGLVCNNVLITNSAPSRDSLGAMNGMATACGSLARAFGPVGSTTLFALSVDKNLLSGQLVHVVLVATASVAFALTMWLKNVKPAWRQKV
ncbi:MFS general substrate transporter [Stereum hirsutum FP-91666 SS1]|uniref:MFS general substrate transporter n=1 Tax=Stereum hirsutum (strain FP-91666) TaxID=721885 RepID=UPI000444A0A3|nr:MFS general substrate transporter [Stereum hirsutum FP-91666 SS1]EIM82631.1 MFS general substrate transporter [Stereum hirsutum FP-91666 SS1]